VLFLTPLSKPGALHCINRRWPDVRTVDGGGQRCPVSQEDFEDARLQAPKTPLSQAPISCTHHPRTSPASKPPAVDVEGGDARAA